MAQLNNLIVTGSSRFLNKVYFSNGGTFNGNLNVNNGNINVTNGNLQLYGKVALQGYDNWLRLNNSVNGTNSPFTYGIYCGNGVLRTDGEFQVGDGGNCFKANSSAITCNKSLIVNAGVDFGYGATIRNAGLELYFSTPFIDFHFDNSNNNYTSRIIEGGKGVLNINGVTCSSSNLAANNVSATNVNVSSRINADAATAIFNNVYVKDELRSTTWAIDNITNLGSTFYVSPCIIFTNPSVYINSKSGTTVTLTITDNNIISSTIGGQTWTSGSKIKLMGRINTSVLGVVNGTMARQLNTTTAKTAYITLNFATTNDCAGIEQGKTYSGSAIGDLKMMMYEVNLNVNGITKNRPVGIRMSSYNEDKKSSIDIYNGTVDDGKPVVRMGVLDELPAVNGEKPTGYGFYAVGNAFFSGRIVSGSGKIGNWNIGTDSLYVPNKTGISSNTGKFAFWAGESNNKNGASDTNAVFRVEHNGVLIATNATINGNVTATSGTIGGCSISNGKLIVPSANISGTLNASQIRVGDFTEYHDLTSETYSRYGFSIVADGNNNPWFQHTPQRDIQISPGQGYNSYKCNGGGTYHIEFEVSSTVQSSEADNYGKNTYVNINIGLYGVNTSGSNVCYIPTGCRSNSSGSVQKVSTSVYLASDVRSFATFIQCAGFGTFSGTLKIRNISIRRMADSALIVDGSITADKIKANAITADKITTNNISGTNGWINLRSGTFKYNDGALAWDGSTMTIGGFKISKYKITNDAIGICSTSGQEWAFWAGASSGGNAPFHVGHDGNLYASKANITGTINASSLTAKQYYKIYDSNGKNERTFVSWSGSMLSFGLVSQNGSNEAEIQILPGSQTVTFNGDIGATQGTIYAGSIDATGSLSVRKTARMDILTFYDYQQDTLPTASDMIYRRPIASAASNNGRVAFLQGASGNKISIRAQYGKSDFSSATFTASSSDIRLKEDVKDSSVNALSKIMQMQIREFNWKQTGVHQELGCVADELELIDPLLTVGGGYDDDGTMNIKSIDTLLLSEYAIKGIQELYKQNKHQQKRIEYLESQLKNK
ncbi:tail fiber domain-containing protein [Blautia massiliensis (ex Durand et al. 2017)]|uniref:tail fiber domain-containing protein n=1 Tax=Blautia massiliensis (ex Durand et al. 2017) TaxID=1737424 RepID=UPI001570F7D5|nr:tail fiber domain-containing protein [Blautia massiliensis (ex Durand et al. 2017)]NSK75183.1 tail fiber domain-containing protein [Blautia massiliensis (ex Durand et al. 2017)]